MKLTETEVQVLRNFAKINPSQIVTGTRLSAVEPSNSIVGIYDFEKAQEVEPFGIFEMANFLAAIDAFTTPEIKNLGDRVVISEGDQKINYYTTPTKMLTAAPEKIDANFGTLECEIDFDLSAEKLATIFKTAAVLKAKNLFIESAEGAIRLTVAKDKLVSSDNSYQFVIRDNIRANKLGENILRIPLVDLRVIGGDYSIKGSLKKITQWKSFAGVRYYIGCKVEQNA